MTAIKKEFFFEQYNNSSGLTSVSFPFVVESYRDSLSYGTNSLTAVFDLTFCAGIGTPSVTGYQVDFYKAYLSKSRSSGNWSIEVMYNDRSNGWVDIFSSSPTLTATGADLELISFTYTIPSFTIGTANGCGLSVYGTGFIYS